jgi:hypothetical protein
MNLNTLPTILFCLASLGVAYAQANDSSKSDAQRTSLIAHINSITAIEIFTDKPITFYRLLIDGKISDEKQAYGISSNHLYLATDTSRPEAAIHIKIGDHNGLLSSPYKWGPNSSMQ